MDPVKVVTITGMYRPCLHCLEPVVVINGDLQSGDWSIVIERGLAYITPHHPTCVTLEQ